MPRVARLSKATAKTYTYTVNGHKYKVVYDRMINQGAYESGYSWHCLLLCLTNSIIGYN